jgi:hypothetical protein
MLTRAVLDLALTVMVEWAVVGLFLRRCETSDGLNIFLINLLTNPLAHLGVFSLQMSFWQVEALVLVGEIGLFRLLLLKNWPQAMALAAAANIASASLSFAVPY